MAKRTFVSKKKVSGVRCTYRAWKEWQEGDFIVGKYVGSSEDNYGKPNWHVEIYEAAFAKKPKLAAGLVGKILGMNSAGMLDKAMKKIEEGEVIQVTYDGTSIIQGGDYEGTKSHKHIVEVMKEDDGSAEESEDDDDSDDDDL